MKAPCVVAKRALGGFIAWAARDHSSLYPVLVTETHITQQAFRRARPLPYLLVYALARPGSSMLGNHVVAEDATTKEVSVMKMMWQRTWRGNPSWGYSVGSSQGSLCRYSFFSTQGRSGCRGVARSGGVHRTHIAGEAFVVTSTGGRFVFSVGLCGGKRRFA
jgi:hypothetical protein